MGRKKKNQQLNIWQCIFAVVILICISIYGYINQNATHKNSANDYNLNNQNTIFEGNNLLASGVEIDYTTGENHIK